MGPTLIDEAPTLARWYYEHATNKYEFFCDVSGAGYIYPPDWAERLKNRQAAFDGFYQWTWRYMKRMDMKTIRVMTESRTSEKGALDSITHVAVVLPHVRFLVSDYSYQGEKHYSHITYTLPGRPGCIQSDDARRRR